MIFGLQVEDNLISNHLNNKNSLKYKLIRRVIHSQDKYLKFSRAQIINKKYQKKHIYLKKLELLLLKFKLKKPPKQRLFLLLIIKEVNLVFKHQEHNQLHQ
ncbi:unnamed protein product [Paramecium primaurelia]|uniref:Uncharacterized protein n=1 Tax=Paramecium primaurelia TaxID=5886 RepID=A0A8S1PZE5_PARPR|nr:unnamed protein product [Paramecium primaurelia]